MNTTVHENSFAFNGVYTPQNDNDNYALDYSRFVVPLVKAVQQLDSINNCKELRIENLESNIEQQQKQIDELENIVAQLQVSNENSKEGELKIETTKDNAFLGQNIPNPFDNSTTIPFKIPLGCKSAVIQVFENATGRTVKIIPVACNQSQLTIEGGTLTSGSYSYTLIVDGKSVDTKQMILTK